MTVLRLTDPTVVSGGGAVLALDDAKRHLRLTTTADDAYVASLVAACGAFMSRWLGRAIVSTVYEARLARFPADARTLELPRPPLVSVDLVTYVDENGVTRTLDPALYDVETATLFGSLTLVPEESWPQTRAAQPGTVTVRWTAGAADAAEVPDDLKHAARLLIGHWYYNREAAGGSMSEAPRAFAALTDAWRTHGWI